MGIIGALLTVLIIIWCVYTAIPLCISVYCFVVYPHAHNDFAAGDTVVDEVIEEIQPVPKYVNTSHQPKTFVQLQTTLQMCKPPQPHSKSYDCSELSAYTEYYLENNGFNTTISASLSQGHAWCTVHNIIGYDGVHVECIPPAFIRPSLGTVELSYNDIEKALAGEYPYEWDWWSAQ